MRSYGRVGVVGTFVLLVVVAVAGGASSAPVTPAASSPPLQGSLTGPTSIGTLLSAVYTVNVSGGPATALNGTVVGAYTYSVSFTAVNRTGIVFGPAAQGVILNGSTTLHLTAGNVTEPVTLSVLITSTYQGQNATQNETLLVNIVQPYVLSTTLMVGSGAGVTQFYLEVDLDGRPVGQISVPTLTAGTTYPVTFRYVATGLSAGWHTFTVSLANEHGLVSFAGGAQQYSQSFYVSGGPPDYTLWYVTGAVAFFGAILIYTMRAGARRRGKSKK